MVNKYSTMSYKIKLSNINSSTIVDGITKDSINYALYNILHETKFRFIAHIVKDNFELELTAKEIEFYDKNIEIIKFPEWNTMPYDVNSPLLKIQSERMIALYRLINHDSSTKKKTLLLISKNALIQKTIGKNDYKFLNFSVGQKISVKEMREILEANCYENSETSIGLGNFSINNGVVDLITFNNQAYRIFIKNDTIEQIKNFDPNSQIGFDNHENILVLPIREIIFNSENIQNFKQNYRNAFGIPTANDVIYENISKGVMYNGFENWLPLFYNNNLNLILDYLPKNSVITYNLSIMDDIRNYMELISKYYELRLNETRQTENKMPYNPVRTDLLYANYNELKNNIKTYINVVFNVNGSEINGLGDFKKIEIDFIKVPNFFKESTEVFKNLQEYLSEN